ncbi:hypothetical protein H8959_003651 [Pygathrix nigripes]
MTARAFWLLCLIVGSFPEAPVERKTVNGIDARRGRSGRGHSAGDPAGGSGRAVQDEPPVLHSPPTASSSEFKC